MFFLWVTTKALTIFSIIIIFCFCSCWLSKPHSGNMRYPTKPLIPVVPEGDPYATLQMF